MGCGSHLHTLKNVNSTVTGHCLGHFAQAVCFQRGAEGATLKTASRVTSLPAFWQTFPADSSSGVLSPFKNSFSQRVFPIQPFDQSGFAHAPARRLVGEPQSHVLPPTTTPPPPLPTGNQKGSLALGRMRCKEQGNRLCCSIRSGFKYGGDSLPS